MQDSEFYIAVEEFKDVFKHYTVIYLEKTHKNAFVEKRNAVNKKTYRFNFTISEEDLPAKPIPVDTTDKETSVQAAPTPAIDNTAAKKPEASSTQATINLGEADSEDVQLNKPQDELNLML